MCLQKFPLNLTPLARQRRCKIDRHHRFSTHASAPNLQQHANRSGAARASQKQENNAAASVSSHRTPTSTCEASDSATCAHAQPSSRASLPGTDGIIKTESAHVPSSGHRRWRLLCRLVGGEDAGGRGGKWALSALEGAAPASNYGCRWRRTPTLRADPAPG